MTAMYTVRRGGSYDRFLMMLEAFLERNCEIHCLSLTPIQIRNPFFNNHVIRLPFHLNNHTLTRISVLILFPFYTLFVGWREKIDLFVAFVPIYAFLQMFPKCLLRKPMITFVRLDLSLGSKIEELSHYLVLLNKAIEYIGLMFSDRVIAVNMSIQEAINNLIGKRKKVEVVVLFNNIPFIPKSKQEDILNVRLRFGISRETKVLVTAGILTHRKHFEILLNCLPKIEMSNLCLLIIGEGSTKSDFIYKNYLKELRETLKIDRKVILPGWIEKEELLKIYCSADLFILPSLREGMPNALLEALGCDIPCLGSNIPGIRDILHYEELMFDPLDEQAITTKIWDFFSDVHYSNYIAELCRERKRAFVFDWKERVFQMVTQRPFHRGEACQSW